MTCIGHLQKQGWGIWRYVDGSMFTTRGVGKGVCMLCHNHVLIQVCSKQLGSGRAILCRGRDSVLDMGEGGGGGGGGEGWILIFAAIVTVVVKKQVHINRDVFLNDLAS